MNPAKKPIKLVSYPSIYKSMAPIKAERVPHANDSLDPRKLIEMITGFGEPMLDNYLTMIASNSTLFQVMKSKDHWLNFFSMLPTSKIKPNLDVINKLRESPDRIWAEYFFNGGNTVHIRKAKDLTEIPYEQDFRANQEVNSVLASLVSEGT